MAANLELRLTGGAANSDPDLSLGGDSSSEVVSATPPNSVFDDVVPNEAWTGDTEYRALSLYNKGDEEAASIEFYISSETDSPDSIIAIGKDSGTQSIADENTTPASPAITFSHPLVDSKMSISNLAVGAAQRLWFRRAIKELAAYHPADIFSLKADYDTVVPPPWDSKFGPAYWTCHSNCTWDGTKYVESGPGIVLSTAGTWAVDYRPARMRVTGATGGSFPGHLELLDVSMDYILDAEGYASRDGVILDFWDTVITDMTRLHCYEFSTVTNIEFYQTFLQGTWAIDENCTASSQWSGSYLPKYVWNGPTGGGLSWLCAAGNLPNPDGSCWLNWDFETDKEPTDVRIKARPDTGGRNAWPSRIRILGSSTGAYTGEEVVLYHDDVPNASSQTPGSWSDWMAFDLHSLYRYLRMEIHEMYVYSAGSNVYVAVNEVQFIQM